MIPLTHELLSRYVGTSHALISQYMNRFRKQDCVQYSRRGIVVHTHTLKALLDRTSDRSISTNS